MVPTAVYVHEHRPLKSLLLLLVAGYVCFTGVRQLRKNLRSRGQPAAAPVRPQAPGGWKFPFLAVPYLAYTLETPFDADECRRRLRVVVHQESPFTLFAQPMPEDAALLFRGQVHPARFSMTRLIHYRNSFLPVIKGRFAPSAPGTRAEIAITMRLHWFVAIFIAGWLSAVGSGAIPLFQKWLTTGKFDAGLPFVVGMFLAGYLMTVLGFAYEAQQARLALAEVFEKDTSASPSTD